MGQGREAVGFRRIVGNIGDRSLECGLNILERQLKNRTVWLGNNGLHQNADVDYLRGDVLRIGSSLFYRMHTFAFQQIHFERLWFHFEGVLGGCTAQNAAQGPQGHKNTA